MRIRSCSFVNPANNTRMRAVSRSLAAALVVVCLAGCSTPKTEHAQSDPDGAQIPDGWKPHLLYLLRSPHPRLHVEVDAVKGCEPNDATLERLKAFLSEHCTKPDGIDIVRSDAIPVQAARGLSEKALARKYMNGPDRTNASQAAFMYVLFYYDELSRDGAAKVAQAGASGATARRSKIANPYADVGLYPAIYFNKRFLRKADYFRGQAEKEILRHEAGHVLGLSRRRVGSVNRHCEVRTCLMHTALRVRGDLHKPQWRLCKECVAELQRSSNQSPLNNLRYVGPVLVRSETNYHVLSLPDRMNIIVGDISDRDCQNFVATVGAEPAHFNDTRNRIYCTAKTESLNDPAKVTDILNRFKDDPFPDVRNIGPKIFLQACARQYSALGQYSNAVSTFQQVILLDPTEPRNYNGLAWIKATCPEASVRNGAEAVAAATKACELTQWKNWTFIDTLAAAYAEAGDFKRAIEFQMQAFRAADSNDSGQRGMRERFVLYKRSQPFRDQSSKAQ